MISTRMAAYVRISGQARPSGPSTSAVDHLPDLLLQACRDLTRPSTDLAAELFQDEVRAGCSRSAHLRQPPRGVLCAAVCLPRQSSGEPPVPSHVCVCRARVAVLRERWTRPAGLQPAMTRELTCQPASQPCAFAASLVLPESVLIGLNSQPGGLADSPLPVAEACKLGIFHYCLK